MSLKKNNSLFVKVLILFFLLSLTACQTSETLPEPDLDDLENDALEEETTIADDEEVIEEETEKEDEAETEEIDPDIFLTLSFSAGDFIVSPNGNLLYFTVPSAPGTLYHVTDISAIEISTETVPVIEWEAMEPLQTPSIMGNTYHLQITGDSRNLLYATSEDQWDETDYGNKTIIYFGRAGFPPGVSHQLELVGDEVPYTFPGSGIMPAWESGTNNIYYLTLSGVYRYSTDDRKKTLIRPASELPGLAGEDMLFPHAFYLDGNNKELAYYNNGTVYIVSLVDRGIQPETVTVNTGARGIVGFEYIFNGRYLALADGQTSWGYGLDDLSLTFVDRQKGEVVMEGNSYLPAGYVLDEQGHMFFKSLGPDNERYFVLLDSNLSEQGSVSARGIIPAEKFSYYADAVRLGWHWGLPYYKDMETHFVEINFD